MQVVVWFWFFPIFNHKIPYFHPPMVPNVSTRIWLQLISTLMWLPWILAPAKLNGNPLSTILLVLSNINYLLNLSCLHSLCWLHCAIVIIIILIAKLENDTISNISHLSTYSPSQPCLPDITVINLIHKT